MKEVVDRGGIAVRIGNPQQMPALPNMRGVLDYAHGREQSERLNTYLLGACRFFVGTASGPLTVPHSFGVPTLYTNAPAAGLIPDFPRTLTLLQKYANDSGRILHAEELADFSLAWTVNPAAYSSFRSIHNTPVELRDAFSEMLYLTASDLPWVGRESSVQQYVYNLFQQTLGKHSGVRLSESFLAANRRSFL